MKKEIKNIVTLPPDGKKGWGYGAYTIAFVYSNKGNFLVKGFLREVKEYLQKLVTQGYKYFVRYSLWQTGKERGYWRFYIEDYYISSPSRNNLGKNPKKWRKYEVRKWNGGSLNPIMEFKRLPNMWIEEFAKLT